MAVDNCVIGAPHWLGNTTAASGSSPFGSVSNQRAEMLRGARPERAKPDLAALAAQADLRRRAAPARRTAPRPRARSSLPPGCIHHTDRRGQYGSSAYRAVLAEWGMRASMSRRGNPYEQRQGPELHRDGEVRGGPSQHLNDYETFDDVVAHLRPFLDRAYNEQRLHSAVGYLSPADFEPRHCSASGLSLRTRLYSFRGSLQREQFSIPIDRRRGKRVDNTAKRVAESAGGSAERV